MSTRTRRYLAHAADTFGLILAKWILATATGIAAVYLVSPIW